MVDRKKDMINAAGCKNQLAAYEYPRQLELVAELPKTPTGKILRRQLRGS